MGNQSGGGNPSMQQRLGQPMPSLGGFNMFGGGGQQQPQQQMMPSMQQQQSGALTDRFMQQKADYQSMMPAGGGPAGSGGYMQRPAVAQQLPSMQKQPMPGGYAPVTGGQMQTAGGGLGGFQLPSMPQYQPQPTGPMAMPQANSGLNPWIAARQQMMQQQPQPPVAQPPSQFPPTMARNLLQAFGGGFLGGMPYQQQR